MRPSGTVAPPTACVRIDVRGTVQGVGFRPTVHRLATDCAVEGWVRNTATGVDIAAWGSPIAVENFCRALRESPPPHAVIDALRIRRRALPRRRASGFRILPSRGGVCRAGVLPDLATCPACVAELFDPRNRRYRYPFLNCTHCGPRYSIQRDIPYDRPGTSMAGFVLCPACRAEYEAPDNRRFHAQPNACPDCGPQVRWLDPHGAPLALRDEALRAAVQALRDGAIVALKGLGGYQLLADAANEATVQRLRERKARPDKPFALMVPTLEQAEGLVDLDAAARALLTGAAAPIVLATRRDSVPGLAPSVAPRTPCLGLMLPYSPLHHLLLHDFGRPLVATSGNRAEEPICIDEAEAIDRLGGIADFFLTHDRPIVRAVDDSVATVVDGQPCVWRRARGYAPLAIALQTPVAPTLAVGGHLKNAVAVARDGQLYLGQHIGDLETPESRRAFAAAVEDLPHLFEVTPVRVACDLHPDYPSTAWARARTPAPRAVQHHVAHALACMADHAYWGDALAFTWDGTGWGADGTIWGGEAFRVRNRRIERVASLLPFRLPGGEAAVREPRRTGLALWTLLERPADDLPPALAAAFAPHERAVLLRMLEQGVHSPVCSSMGRLFDGLAACLGLCPRSTFEGQAALELETLARSSADAPPYPVTWLESTATTPLRLDWRPLLRGALDDARADGTPARAAWRFHATLAEAMVVLANLINESHALLSGGCFQNRLLAELAGRRLRAAGFTVLAHRRIPPNDGGLAAGQAVAVGMEWDGMEGVTHVSGDSRLH